MKSVTYEELSELNDNLPNHNTILIGAGRYYGVRKKLYDEYVKKSNNIRNMYDEYGIYKKWLGLYKTISKKEYQK